MSSGYKVVHANGKKVVRSGTGKKVVTDGPADCPGGGGGGGCDNSCYDCSGSGATYTIDSTDSVGQSLGYLSTGFYKLKYTGGDYTSGGTSSKAVKIYDARGDIATANGADACFFYYGSSYEAFISASDTDYTDNVDGDPALQYELVLCTLISSAICDCAPTGFEEGAADILASDYIAHIVYSHTTSGWQYVSGMCDGVEAAGPLVIAIDTEILMPGGGLGWGGSDAVGVSQSYETPTDCPTTAHTQTAAVNISVGYSPSIVDGVCRWTATVFAYVGDLGTDAITGTGCTLYFEGDAVFNGDGSMNPPDGFVQVFYDNFTPDGGTSYGTYPYEWHAIGTDGISHNYYERVRMTLTVTPGI